MNIFDITFRGMNINQLAVWFFIYSFFGWAMECVVIRKQLGYWENRGFAKLPFCVIYGFGVFIAFNIFSPIENNYVALYIAGAIAATAFEFLTAQVMLKLFGEVWWNYDHLRFNYKGIICLQSTLAWGVLAVLIFGVFNKIVEKLVFSIDMRVVTPLSVILVVSYLTDFTYHFTKNLNKKRASDAVEIESKRMEGFAKIFRR
ncbi:MAG: putative ABC transporter permease [Lachnospira sp.]